MKKKEARELDPIDWLLLIVIAFSLTIHNVTLLPSIQTALVRFALILATVIMDIIVVIYYPLNKSKETKNEN